MRNLGHCFFPIIVIEKVDSISPERQAGKINIRCSEITDA